MTLSCCVLWWPEKNWPFCCCLQEVYAFFITAKNKWCQLKNLAANVNHIIVTRLREVYSDLGWLPQGCHDPEAVECVGTKFSANGTIKTLLSCDPFPEIAFAGKTLCKRMLHYYQNNVNELFRVLLMAWWSALIQSQVILLMQHQSHVSLPAISGTGLK